MCDHHSRDKKGAVCRCGGGLPVEKFMQPCLLILLKQRSSHGYDLLQQLTEFGFSERLDPGSVYRTLRRLEDEGSVTSHWDVGEGGPARRLYSLSDEGEEMLHAWAVHIRQQRKRMDAFLERYQSIFGKQN
ncbi:MAG: helix-turn-helix transcriptional regulator [Thermacetogeniaceae bacterium]|jgi:PadR family transcriptional regulator PadR|nr:helix-turn-helix transcriptional regulator [Thermoanaerobacterales bacterium]